MLQVNSPELRIEELLSGPLQTQVLGDDFIQEQRKDTQLRQLIDYIENGILPDGDKDSKKIVSQASLSLTMCCTLWIVRSQQRGVLLYQNTCRIRFFKNIAEEGWRGIFQEADFMSPHYKWWWQKILIPSVFVGIVLSVL